MLPIILYAVVNTNIIMPWVFIYIFRMNFYIFKTLLQFNPESCTERHFDTLELNNSNNLIFLGKKKGKS